ncbi:MAG: outer membrane protein assembly factor, partial [Desulfosudaceae bacterium]
MLIILMCSLSSAALAQSEPEEEQVSVLLFEPVVYSPETERDKLAKDLSERLSRKLQDRGVTVMTPEESFLPGLSPERKQSLAREKGADYALWGSLTVLGRGFSLDMTLLKTTTAAAGRHFFVSGDSIDSLDGRVDQLVSDMVAGLFRQKQIKEIQVKGNARIEAEAIKRVISTRKGELFDRETLSRDLEAIHEMGYFEDIRVTSRKTEEGRIVTFHVRERPTVRKINIKKNLLFEDEEILAELDLKRGSIVNLVEINNSIKKIKRLYTDKNYHNVKVSYDLISRENNQADLEFTIERGDKFRIRQINFEGNQKYSDKELRKIIKTSEKGLLLWIITSAGDLKEDQLQQDLGRLAAHYHNHGYIDARISDPRIVYGEEPDTSADASETPTGKEEEAGPPSSGISNQMISGEEEAHLDKLDEEKERDKGIFITFEIEEGRQYQVDEVNLSGDLIKSRAEMEEQISIAEGSVFNRSQVQQDMVRLDAIYSDQGYYYADIYPETTKNEEDLTIDINYKITKGEPVYFDNIIITGNTKTRDKVIRRQLDVYEQELYSGQRLKKSVSRLYQLNYFENVKVDTVEKPDQNAIDLKIDVTEKPTGEFSFGGGYSSLENAFATASISQDNLFGRGQKLSLQAEIGGTTTQYRLSFTEPWLFDIPLSAGIDLYDWAIDYDSYDKKATGGGLRFGYPVFENTRLYLSNTYE